MNAAFNVAANEHGVARVFSLSMDASEADALKTNTAVEGAHTPQARALGVDVLNAGHIEIFPIADLGDMSLCDYLIEGDGIQRDAIEPDRLKLANLEGWIMIVYSGAFDGRAQHITPLAELTLIGTYPQDGTDWSTPVDLSTPSAHPTPENAPKTPVRKRPSDAAMSGRIATVALLVAFAVVGLMFWVGS
ncbi:MAG: hypothetical protein ABJQ70_21595 [Roseobacter sp.]